MVYKQFRVNIVARISAILSIGYVSIYIILYTHFWLVGIWTILLTLFLISNLIYYIEGANREMTNFLLAIKQGDFTNTHTHKSRYGFDMGKAYSEILQVFQRLNTEGEANHLFLQTVVEHVSIALITFNSNGAIISSNKSAKNLFKKQYIKSLQSLQSFDGKLYEQLIQLEAGKGELFKTLIDGELVSLSLRATDFKLKGQDYKIVSLQDIKQELEEKEVESWQKLIRVLTHEIMNSAIPISTLSSVISQMLEDEKGKPIPLSTIDDDVAEDVVGGLKTIESRSKGLVKFVEAYKSLTKINPPEYELIRVSDFLSNIENLMKAEWGDSVAIEINVPQSMTISGDRQLLEQVAINLMKNAREATLGLKKPHIMISSTIKATHQILHFKDNGPGIEKEHLENIFVPFFTTKKGGSGVGLSLSRQIMRLHKGSISVNTEIDRGTTFSLEF